MLLLLAASDDYSIMLCFLFVWEACCSDLAPGVRFSLTGEAATELALSFYNRLLF